MRNKKRGQITIFIIVGIMILAVFGSFYFIMNDMANKKLQKEKDTLLKKFISKTALDYYVDTCVKETLKRGVKEIGINGGYIFPEEGGIITPKLTSGKITILLRNKETSPENKYPCRFGQPPLFCKYSSESYSNVLFGSSDMPPLSSPLLRLTVKKELEGFMSYNIPRCTNVSRIINITGFSDYTYLGENVTSSIAFTQDKIVGKVRYALLFETPAGKITHPINIETVLNIRFKSTYLDIYDIIQKEVFDINSNFTKNIYNLSDEGIVVSEEKVPEGTIYTLNDTKSFIDDKEFVFKFAKSNRAPALNLILKNESRTYDYFSVIGSDNYNKIAITPYAIDPDEGDTVEYSVSSDIPLILDSAGRIDYTPSESDEGLRVINISASDGTLSDWQEVRALIDPKLDLFVGGEIPDTSITTPTVEDPYIFEATPSESFDIAAKDKINFGDTSAAASPGISNTIPYPEGSYDEKDIIFKGFNKTGDNKLIFNIERKYSNNITDNITKEVNFYVAPCLPKNNPCCEGNIDDPSSWAYSDKNKVCDNDAEGTHMDYSGEIAKKISVWQYCSGGRGNICSGSLDKQSPIELDICGDSAVTECRRKKAYSIIDGKGWCRGGNYGCSEFYDDRGLFGLLRKNKGIVAPPGTIKGARPDKIDDNFIGGCDKAPDRRVCDNNFDGIFNGVCINSKCIEP